tara:strand:- start:555 stop:923 length:369 start_codon:yes stop_codon:yes gene_type:complete
VRFTVGAPGVLNTIAVLTVPVWFTPVTMLSLYALATPSDILAVEALVAAVPPFARGKIPLTFDVKLTPASLTIIAPPESCVVLLSTAPDANVAEFVAALRVAAVTWFVVAKELPVIKTAMIL